MYLAYPASGQADLVTLGDSGGVVEAGDDRIGVAEGAGCPTELADLHGQQCEACESSGSEGPELDPQAHRAPPSRVLSSPTTPLTAPIRPVSPFSGPMPIPSVRGTPTTILSAPTP